jgi:hypothetical protein
MDVDRPAGDVARHDGEPVLGRALLVLHGHDPEQGDRSDEEHWGEEAHLPCIGRDSALGEFPAENGGDRIERDLRLRQRRLAGRQSLQGEARQEHDSREACPG